MQRKMAYGIYAAVFLVTLITGYCDGKMVDMTHYLDNRTMYWPGHGPFILTELFAGPLGPFDWVAGNEMMSPEHIGTHLDAPNHFVKNGKSIDDIPLSDLIGPGVVIDITERATKDRDALLLVSDLEEWEARNGRIPDGAIVLQKSGWERYWHEQNSTAYLGLSLPPPVNSTSTDWDTHSPGFSKEAAEFLAYERNIKMVGVDTINGDRGNDHTYPAHGVLSPKDILIIENVKNVGRIPEAGTTIYVLPINIRSGTGAPVRMFATWDEEPLVAKNEDSDYNSATHATYQGICVILVLCIVYSISTIL